MDRGNPVVRLDEVTTVKETARSREWTRMDRLELQMARGVNLLDPLRCWLTPRHEDDPLLDVGGEGI